MTGVAAIQNAREWTQAQRKIFIEIVPSPLEKRFARTLPRSFECAVQFTVSRQNNSIWCNNKASYWIRSCGTAIEAVEREDAAFITWLLCSSSLVLRDIELSRACAVGNTFTPILVGYLIVCAFSCLCFDGCMENIRKDLTSGAAYPR